MNNKNLLFNLNFTLNQIIKNSTTFKKINKKKLNKIEIEALKKTQESLFANIKFLKKKIKPKRNIKKIISNLKIDKIKKVKIRRSRKNSILKN